MIKFLNEVSSENIKDVGGKAAALGELIKSNIPVAEGFVITTDVSNNDIKNLKKDIYEAFDKLHCNFVAVRSSATIEDSPKDSFAGQFITYLNVQKVDLIERIKTCMDSINSDRIKAYCDEKKIDISKIKIAVIVQRMVNSEVAGVAFTMHPVSKNKKQILIEAGFGLGEAVVGGIINPDDYVVDKDNFNILSIDIGEQEKMLVRIGNKTQEISLDAKKARQQKLSNELIIEIAKMSKNVEDYFRKPMDIEWAVEKNKIYFMQARPITIVK